MKQTRRVQVHIGEGVTEQCAHSMRCRYDYRKPSRNYFLYIENARTRPFPPAPPFPSATPVDSPIVVVFEVLSGTRNDLFPLPPPSHGRRFFNVLAR